MVVTIFIVHVFHSKMWVFADVPLLVKLLRTRTVAPNGGLVVPKDGDGGGTALLSRQCFRDVLEAVTGELSSCHKLNEVHLEVSRKT